MRRYTWQRGTRNENDCVYKRKTAAKNKINPKKQKTKSHNTHCKKKNNKGLVHDKKETISKNACTKYKIPLKQMKKIGRQIHNYGRFWCPFLVIDSIRREKSIKISQFWTTQLTRLIQYINMYS